MRQGRGRLVRGDRELRDRLLAMGVGSFLLLNLLAGGPALARGPRRSGPALWIVADRIVGFVPFTVYVYGRVRGAEPGQVELCRSEVAWLAESSSGRRADGRPTSDDPARDDEGAPCAAGNMVRTPDGYDYGHDLRFDYPGIYHVQLTMIDASGRRITSNTLQVNAF